MLILSYPNASDGSDDIYIRARGAVDATGSSQVRYSAATSLSDNRLKHNEVKITNALEYTQIEPLSDISKPWNYIQKTVILF